MFLTSSPPSPLFPFLSPPLASTYLSLSVTPPSLFITRGMHFLCLSLYVPLSATLSFPSLFPSRLSLSSLPLLPFHLHHLYYRKNSVPVFDSLFAFVCLHIYYLSPSPSFNPSPLPQPLTQHSPIPGRSAVPVRLAEAAMAGVGGAPLLRHASQPRGVAQQVAAVAGAVR